MGPAAATADLPLYLQMSRYAKGSTAMFELRAERYRAELAAGDAQKADKADDDALITGSIGEADQVAAAETEDGFSFGDLLDVVNPLHHLPVISTLYRELTDDGIGAAARIVGGAIYGGPIGAGLSVADAMLEQVSGDYAGGHIMAWLNGETEESGTALASAPPTQPSAAPAAHAGSTPRAGELPSLSPEAFNALLALGNGAALPNPSADKETGTASAFAPSGPENFAARMAQGLERYSALKGDNRP